MTTGEICFNPALLQTDRQYLADVDELTQGSLVEPDYPCVPVDEVSASFVLSGLDPGRPEQLRDYFRRTPYYQTLACLWEKNNFSAEALPWQFKPLEVNRNSWQRDPNQVVRSLLFRPEPLAMGTMVYLHTEFPQTKASLQALLPYWEKDESLCTDFALMGAYELTNNPKLKKDIASSVQFRLSPLVTLFEEFPPIDHASLLREEHVEQAIPILKWLFELESIDEKNPWIAELVAQTLAFIGGPKEYEYLANIILDENNGRYRKKKAMRALLQAGVSRPEAISSLARILNMPFWEARFEKWSLLERMYPGGLLPDPRLLPGLYNILRKSGGEFSGDENDNIPRWMARCGKESHGYLLRLLKQRNLSDDFRQGIIPVVVAVDDLSVQTELKKIVRGEGIEGDPQFQLDLRYQVIGGLARSEGTAAHQTLLELINEFKDKKGDPLERIAINLFRLPPDRAKEALSYYFAMRDIAEQNPDPKIKEEASYAYERLAFKFDKYFSQNFEQFNLDRQRELVDLWVLWGNGVGDLKDLLAAAAPKARRMLRKRIQDIEQVRFSDEELRDIFVSNRFSAAVRKDLLGRLARRESSVDFLVEIARNSEVHDEVRDYALRALTNNPDPKIESILVEQFIRDKQMPKYFVEIATAVLKDRAKNPRYKTTATLALQQAFPL